MNDIDPQLDALPHEPQSNSSFSWPPAADASVIDAFVATWRNVCLHPTSFFQRMPREGGYGAAIAYYLVIGVTVAGIQLFWRSVLGNWNLAAVLLPESESRYGGIVQFLFSPIILLITLFVVTGICHLILVLLNGARNGFDTSTRVFAFSYSPAVLAAIPVLGNLAALVWMTGLAVIGLREAHETSGGKAAVAVLIPFFLTVFLLVLAVIAGLLMGVLNTRL